MGRAAVGGRGRGGGAVAGDGFAGRECEVGLAGAGGDLVDVG